MQEVAIFGQTATNFGKEKLRALGSNLPPNFPKMEDYQRQNRPYWAKVAVHIIAIFWGTTLYKPLIVTFALSCIVRRYCRFCMPRAIFHTPLLFRLKFSHPWCWGLQREERLCQSAVKLFSRIPTYVTTIPQRHRQTDGRTDGQTTCHGSTGLSAAWRGNCSYILTAQRSINNVQYNSDERMERFNTQ